MRRVAIVGALFRASIRRIEFGQAMGDPHIRHPLDISLSYGPTHQRESWLSENSGVGVRGPSATYMRVGRTLVFPGRRSGQKRPRPLKASALVMYRPVPPTHLVGQYGEYWCMHAHPCVHVRIRVFMYFRMQACRHVCMFVCMHV